MPRTSQALGFAQYTPTDKRLYSTEEVRSVQNSVKLGKNPVVLGTCLHSFSSPLALIPLVYDDPNAFCFSSRVPVAGTNVHGAGRPRG